VLAEILTDTIAAVLPLACVGCGRAGGPVCPRCAPTLVPPPAAAPPAGVDRWTAAFAYTGVATSLVSGVKYRGTHAATGWMADVMSRTIAPPLPDVITWAPTTAARRRERGFDHAELLARRIARRVRRPVRRLLVRLDARAQTGLPASERRRGPEFAARGSCAGAVLDVDDVATTGATLAGAASALRVGGADQVVAVTAARTPPP
jgi:predicted amidophosphoribosyltransferase